MDIKIGNEKVKAPWWAQIIILLVLGVIGVGVICLLASVLMFVALVLAALSPIALIVYYLAKKARPRHRF